MLPRSDSALREALEANGQRFTEQRAAVYRYLCGALDHPTADEVFTSVRAEIADISLATVYKALETLVSCGLAAKLTNGDGSARYDPRTETTSPRCSAGRRRAGFRWSPAPPAPGCPGGTWGPVSRSTC